MLSRSSSCSLTGGVCEMSSEISSETSGVRGADMFDKVFLSLLNKVLFPRILPISNLTYRDVEPFCLVVLVARDAPVGKGPIGVDDIDH